MPASFPTDEFRRAFLRQSGKAALVLACGSGLLALTDCTAVDAPGTGEEPAPVRPLVFHDVDVNLDLASPSLQALSAGTALRLEVNVEKSTAMILLARQAGGELLAFSASCTHAGCTVNPPAGGAIECPCHGSRFGLDGEVLRGPAASPLESIPLTQNGNTLVMRFRRLGPAT